MTDGSGPKPQHPSDTGADLPARLAVVGLGLIGGSLAKRVRHTLRGAWILGVDPSPDARDAARSDFTCDEVSATLDGRLSRCDLVVLAAPVPDIAALVREIGPHLAEDAVVTDVGGAKAAICAAADAAGLVSFCGAHPMMGTEKSGYAASSEDLLTGGAVAICPGERTLPASVERVEALWRGLGNRTIRCAPADHDRAVALVSHLPYLVASALCRVSAGRWDELAEFLASSGFLGTSRLAADGTVGEAALANEALPPLAASLSAELASLAALFATDPGEARGALAAARAFRRALKT